MPSPATPQFAEVLKVDIATGKTEPRKPPAPEVGGRHGNRRPRFSKDDSAYTYVCVQNLSNAYVVTGLK